jgi:excinuclease UvrABC nuclease subunit
VLVFKVETVDPNKVDLVLNREQIHMIPDSKKGIYCFRNALNSPLYIGKSINLKQRIQQHKTTSDFYFMVDKIEVYYFNEIDHDMLDDYETYFINTLKPTFNKSKAFYKYEFLKEDNSKDIQIQRLNHDNKKLLRYLRILVAWNIALGAGIVGIISFLLIR